MPIITKIGIIISVLLSPFAHAQTVSEWFSQKSTQKKYLLQQIVALQAYSKYLKAGYGIATGGLGSITGSLRSENGLHSAYYSKLKTAGPPVKNNDMVKDILKWQKDILNGVQELKKQSGLTSDGKNYLVSAGAAVIKDCDQELQTLANITQDGKMEMSDADRLSLLIKVHTSMMDKYRFITALTTQVKLYAKRRQAEQNQLISTKKLYGIN